MLVFEVRDFRDPLLHTMGEMTVYHDHQPVQAHRVIASTIRLASDTDPITALLIDFLRKEGYLKDVEAFVRKTHYNLQKEGLVGSRLTGWLLTPEGIREAIEIRSTYAPDRNVTTFWLDRRIGPDEIRRIQRYLSKKCRRSVDFGEVRDLLDEYLTNIMARDSLRKRITDCNPPDIGQLCSWTYRSALSRFRNEGRDALTRSFKGARHEKDLLEDDPIAATVKSPEFTNNCALYATLGETGQEGVVPSAATMALPLVDVLGGDLRQDSDESIVRHEGAARIEALIRQQRSGASERFARIYRLLVGGASIVEMANIEKVSRNRMAALVTDLRTGLRKAASEHQISVRILRYVLDEPYATRDDILSDVAEADVRIIKNLQKAGYLLYEEGSYLLTQAGARRIEELRLNPDFSLQLGI